MPNDVGLGLRGYRYTLFIYCNNFWRAVIAKRRPHLRVLVAAVAVPPAVAATPRLKTARHSHCTLPTDEQLRVRQAVRQATRDDIRRH